MTASGGSIGQSIERLGGRARVTGEQQYIADLPIEQALHVKLVQLPVARGRLIAIEPSAALEVDGVQAVFTASDLPQPMPRYGPSVADRPLLAVDETKFSGEPVAAVAARTEDAAELGASLVRVQFEELTPVLTIEDALDPAAPLVQDPALRPHDPHGHSNIFEAWQFGWGDVSSCSAHCIVENEYRFPMVTHFAIEPHAFIAAPDANGVTVWSATQHPFVLQRVVAAALAWPISRVRIVAPDPGGGFGGKGWPKFEPLLACLALRLGRPVRLVLTLEETFQQARRASARIHARTGLSRDGRIVFQDLAADFLLGAYVDIGARVVSKASYAACGPYRTPHARIAARAVLSHTTPSTAFRGFGTPQASWAVESQLNEAASRLGLDPVEIRRRNLPKHGEAFIPNDTPADGDWEQALSRAAAAIGWGEPLAPGRGRGISLGLKSSSTASASMALIRLHHDGSLSVLSGTSDMGQGARTVLAQIAASELGVPQEAVAIVMGDTAVVPFDSSTSASRSTVFMGNAVRLACDDLKSKLKRAAAAAFDVPEAQLAIAGGRVTAGSREWTFADVLRRHFGPARGEMMGFGEEIGAPHVPDHPLGGKPAFWELMCSAAEVSVDFDTGAVEIVRLVLASDVGKALNPRQVEAQDEGAAVMGVGHSLMEHLVLDEHGRIANLGAIDYRIPTTQDVARETTSILVENGDGPGPYGAKGAGEGGILGVAAAIGAAVNQAAGVIIRELPLTPERVWRAITGAAVGEAQGGSER